MQRRNNNRRSPLLPRTKYLKHSLKLTLEEMYNGTTRHLLVQRNIACDQCRGSGSMFPDNVRTETCELCYGRGIRIKTERISNDPDERIERQCELCRGDGKAVIQPHRCENCRGCKTVPNELELVCTVRPGTREGQKIIYPRKGPQEANKLPGDVILIVEAVDHTAFQRDGDDLVMSMSLDLVESLCGFEKTITTLDKRQLRISSPRGKVVENNEMKCVFGEGMPKYSNPSERGKLIIRFEVNFPKYFRTRFTPRIKECLPTREQDEFPLDAQEKRLEYISPEDLEKSYENARIRHEMMQEDLYPDPDDYDPANRYEFEMNNGGRYERTDGQYYFSTDDSSEQPERSGQYYHSTDDSSEQPEHNGQYYYSTDDSSEQPEHNGQYYYSTDDSGEQSEHNGQYYYTADGSDEQPADNGQYYYRLHSNEQYGNKYENHKYASGYDQRHHHEQHNAYDVHNNF